MGETPLADLPEYWQLHIHQLREERASLRKGVITPEDLAAISRGREIRGLRRQVAKMRIQRNEARAEVAALRAELESRSK